MASNVSSILETSIGKDADCERVFKRFTYKCLQIIVQSRIERPVLQGKDTSNDYFSINLSDSGLIDEQIKYTLEGIKSFPVKDRPICVEIALRTNDGDHMFLETWDISFNLSSLDMSASKVQHIFTRMGLTLKSLMAATRATPAYRLAKNQGEKGGGYKLNYRFYLGPPKTHMLGEGFKSMRAGAVPSAFGLLSVGVSYRTKLLLSPDTTAPSSSVMQVTDDYFMKENRATRHSSCQGYSDPKPCHSSVRRRPSLSSPEHMAATPYNYTISPSSQGTDEDMMSKLSADSNPLPWPLASILNIDELPEPAVGAFSVQRPNPLRVEENDLPFEGLMKRSMMARLEQKQRQELSERTIDSGFERSSELRQQGTSEDEKENLGVLNRFSNKMPFEDDFVIVDPPFACDDDPRDVKSFLGVMFRAPHLYDVSDSTRPTINDYLNDVGQMVSRLEEDMPMLDEFCQSVIEFTSTEDEDAATLFS